MDALLQKEPRAVERGYSAEALGRLLQMKDSMDRGEPPLSHSDDESVRSFDGRPIDLSDIWELNTAGKRPELESDDRSSLKSVHSVAARVAMLLLTGAATAVGVWAGWYFGHAEVSILKLSCIMGVAAALTWGVTAWILFGRGHA
jgi:hypothetical protein